MVTKGSIMRWLILFVLLVIPRLAKADPDMIMGIDSTTGQESALTPEDAGTLIGVGGEGLDANFDATNGNIITGADESKKLLIYRTTGNGVAIYYHSSGKLVIKCVVGGVEGDCDPGVEVSSGKKWFLKDSGGNRDFEYTESTGKISAATVDAEDSGVNLTLYYPLCGGDLVGVDPATGTAGHIWDKSPLDTAPTATAVTGTNQTYGVARFPDSDGDYGVQIQCPLPPGWTGNIDAVAWGKTTGTGNYRLQIATKCYATDEANDASFNTATVTTFAAGTSGRLNRYTVSNITATGCAANELMMVRVFRNRTEGSDTLNNTFDLKSVRLWVRNTY